MLTLTLEGLLLGALLGQRFNVFVLVPASVVTICTAAILPLRGDAGAGSLALGIVLVVTGLQTGYLVGTAGRLIVARGSAGAAVHGHAR
jgi:hypothetical protein